MGLRHGRFLTRLRAPAPRPVNPLLTQDIEPAIVCRPRRDCAKFEVLVHLQKRAGLACLGVGLLALAGRAALLPWFPIPEPSVHDEFSYLLGADTFAHGRLANPPHPMWVHFETFHVNFQPTYASKYPPAQALFLALGWKLFGHPWFGVWLSCGVMCGALCWMLQGWLPPRYALLGGLMAVAQWSLAGYWINSYWGGAVAAAAGALVVGAVPRLVRRPTASAAALAALGVIVLANSRPYEGALTTVAAAAALWLWRRRSGRRMRDLLAPRLILPVAAILLSGLTAMGYYNYRVAGDPLVLPYSLHQKAYAASPIFWMLPPQPAPVYRHEVIRRFWEDWDKLIYDRAHAWPPRVAIAFYGMLPFFLTLISLGTALVAVFLRRSRKVRIVLAILAVPTAGLLLERNSMPHYIAPAAGLALALVLLGVQYLHARLGARAVIVFAGIFFTDVGLHVARNPTEYANERFAAERRRVVERLASAGGRHLVIVRYASSHDSHLEWVHNQADIDGSPIVWARDMGEARNRELLDYYRNRRIWLLEADAPDPALAPYAPR